MSASKNRIRNPYPLVIDLLESRTLDCRAMCVALAKHYPTTFLNVHAKLTGAVDVTEDTTDTDLTRYPVDLPVDLNEDDGGQPVQSDRYIKLGEQVIDTEDVWFKHLCLLAKTSGKIPAIKKVRETFGTGIKESKEFVEQYVYKS